MIDGLRPYAEMRSSGVDWLPALPNGWEIHRAKYSFREADDRSESGGEELLSVSHKTGVTPRSQKNITMFMAESYEGHKVCRPGDIVVNTMWAWMAAIGVSRHIGIVSPAYGIYRPRTAERFEPKFLDYLLRIEAYRAEYLRSSRGVTTSRLRLYPPDFLNIPFVQPPLDDQRLIVRFLDWHGAQTAKLVRAKKKIIALLNEQKQAIIHRAVTRGLDPNAKLKPSGIPWLGDVPEGGEVRKLATLFRVIGSGTTPSGPVYYEAGSIPWVMSGDLNNGIIHSTKRTVTDLAVKEVSALRIYPKNSLIVAMYGATIGKTGVLAVEACTNQACCVLASPRSTVNVHYVQMFVNLAKSALVEQAYGGGQPNINAEVVKALRIPVPPIEQQEEILSRIKSGHEDTAILNAHREIALIQEFRARLIADVVTGKLDVRAAAARLPEVTEPEPIDDLGEGDDLDEAIDATENEEVAA
jgi:type I restriction enzyme S subunit